MVKNIIKSVIFTIIAAFIFIKISYVLRPNDGDFVYIKTYGMQPKNSIDMVYFGGSSVLTYWIPMEAYQQYGFTSFNFANSTMPAQLEKYCIIEALKNQSPELLVVDVRPFEYAENLFGDPQHMYMFDEARIRGFVDCFRYSFNRTMAIKNGVPKENGRIDYYFDISKYHTNFAALLNENNWKYAFGMLDDDTKKFGGFRPVIRYGEIERIDISDIAEEQPFSETLDPIYLDLVNYCADFAMNVMFIVPPYAESEEHRQKHNYMRRIAEENGIKFIDCNDIFDEIGMNAQTDFYDVNHLQIFGAQKYTKWLGQYLKKTYGLPDRRGESKYADWDMAYELWIPKLHEIEQGVLAKMPEEIQAKIMKQN